MLMTLIYYYSAYVFFFKRGRILLLIDFADSFSMKLVAKLSLISRYQMDPMASKESDLIY